MHGLTTIRAEGEREVPSVSTSAEVEGWIRELRGQEPPEDRPPAEWGRVLGAVVETLAEAKSWPGTDGSPWVVLDEIAHRTLERSVGARRAALAGALRARWDRAAGPSERVWLLGRLALVGEADSVPFLAGALRGGDPAVREHALRALESNPSAEAEDAVGSELAKDGAPPWRLAVANALGARAGPTAAGRLRDLVAAEKDADVRASLEAALARIEGR